MKKIFWDLVSTIKNGQLVNKLVVKHIKKKNCEMLLNILWDEGYIIGYKTSISNPAIIKIYLKYNVDKSPAITNFKIISKSSLKIYYSLKQLWKINDNQGLIVLSTNKGLLSLSSCKKFGIGGEPVLIIK
tara:strand:+ start:216 stop:605 length:390 start_codon:yes stop_codon:yes gene_type:complete